jgi:VWFA-related protein
MNTLTLRYLARHLTYAVAIVLSSPVVSPQSPAPAIEKEARFRAEANVVLVPVVVRDARGNAVGNLHKEDFQLFDKGKAQIITSFAVEEISTKVAEDRSVRSGDQRLPAGVALASQIKAAPMAIPDRFVALVFDDYHLKIGNPNIPYEGYLVWARDAARRYIGTLKPSDRVAIFTTTGETALDFTSDRTRLEQTLLKLHLSPDKHQIEWESQRSLGQLQAIVRRMSVEPGQRTVVLLSPGFELRSEPSWSLLPDAMDLINRSIRSGLVIDTLNVRGLAIEGNGPDEVLFRLSDGTGGTYVRDRNDYDSALRQMAAAPEYRYILGFSPENLKQDGSLHTLKVSVRNAHGLEVQARRAYWDAKPATEAVENAGGKGAAETPQVSESETRAVANALGVAAAAPVTEPIPETALVTVPAPKPPLAQPPRDDEISTHDEPVTFRAQSNLVEVPVVVRDRQGHAIGNLRKEDFRLFDKGKRQEITKFSVQKSAAPAIVEAQSGSHPSDAAPGMSAPQVAPTHFIAFVFDDVHMRTEDTPQIRDAVRRYLSTSLRPGDRVALFTTSGKIAVDFTDKPASLDEALLKIRPSPLTSTALRFCLYISYFQAVQIDQQVSLHPIYPDDLQRSAALKTAVYDVARCTHGADGPSNFDYAMQEVRDAFLNGRQETRENLAVLGNIVRRMALLPGRRSIILASPGFFVSPELQDQGSDLIALAVRSRVLINTIDARGVWTNPMFDASQPGPAPAPDVIAFKDMEGTVADDELFALSEGTGGTASFDNDFSGAVRKAATTPEYLYVLGFSPQNLKLDGSFHALKVTLSSNEKASLQVRRGYWAPKHAEDAEAVVKQEIEDAVFSRDEIHNLPAEMYTRVTKTGDQAKLNVLTSVDLKLIRLRKADDRNRNDLTIVAAVFDANGNFIAGTEKILQLRLRDETVQGLEQKPPVTIPASFDLKTGAYLVRLVVRDAEGQQITSENAAVQIP